MSQFHGREGVSHIASYLDTIDQRCRNFQHVAQENNELTQKSAQQRLDRQTAVKTLKDNLADYKKTLANDQVFYLKDNLDSECYNSKVGNNCLPTKGHQQ